MGEHERKSLQTSILMLLWLPLAFTQNIQNTVTVQTKIGTLTGLSHAISIKESTFRYKEFRGIPYAQPPVGNLRFEKPVPFGTLGSNFDATKFGPVCMQINLYPDLQRLAKNVSEDCLFLNIYVPESATATDKKSVMIFIHGGGYILGQGDIFDGSPMSVLGDVVVVNFNYRLGLFGFLTSEDDVIPGNYGLWDQKLALQWVKNNIESFGGDANSITIFGQSAGAFSVMLQALHPGNMGNFHRVIAQSGTADSIISFSKKARKNAKMAAEYLNCNNNLTADTLKCFKNKPVDDLFSFYLQTTTLGGFPKHFVDQVTLDIHTETVYAPVVDRDFFNTTPSNILRYKLSPAFDFYQSLDVIIGNTEDEGNMILSFIEALANKTSFSLKEGIPSDFLCNHVINPYIRDIYGNNSGLALAVCNFYSSDGTMVDQGYKALDFFGDIIMYTYTVNSLNVHAVKNTKTKQYQFIFRKIPSDFKGIFGREGYPWFKKAGHGGELRFLFPTFGGRDLQSMTNNDITFVTKFIKYWTNFAKTGDVNGAGLPRWPEYNLSSKQYLILDDVMTVQDNLYQDRVDFWLTQNFIFNQPILG